MANLKKELKIFYKNLNELQENPKNSRVHSEKQIAQIAKSIEKFGFNNPILINQEGVIIAGHCRYLAAKKLGLEEVPTVCLSHMTPEQIRAYIIADNKLAENSGWDKDILKIELEYLMSLDLDFDATITGFELPEIDLIINSEAIEETKKVSEKNEDDEFFEETIDIPKRVKPGELWKLGEHLIFCGDALQEQSYQVLMGSEKAQMVFNDSPYNVKIKGNVTKQKHHEEFAQGSGEMSKDEFTEFLKTAFSMQAKYSIDGSIHFQCMDFRHMLEILNASQNIYADLINLCVWDKGTGGMGSLYRSQHELVFVFKNGTAPHINNVELGVHGRYRTNVWKYRGMHASNPQAKVLTRLHPTVKPTTMIMDAILDCSAIGGIILDSFGGSGSTLIAAERTKRKARIIELEPKYCDVILYRWEKLTGKHAILVNKGENHGQKR